jgi:hypothetical protein
MTLTDGVLKLAHERGVDKASMRRVVAALATLEREMGALDFLAVTGQKELAQKVRVPGDPAIWIVIGEWDDGSMDIVREEGSFSSDCLVGWMPGQTIAQYKASLAAIPDDPPTTEEKRKNVPPLRGFPV